MWNLIQSSLSLPSSAASNMAEANESSDNGRTTKERIFDFGTSDFATLLKTYTFVDKTLMIEEVVSCSSKVLVTAPRRFGKSTNIDMIKRFFEIEVDSKCLPMAVNTTKNYQLFKGNNLDIFKKKEIFNKYFGKLPVVHIDCLPLIRAHDFENTDEALRTIIGNTFYQHSYFLRVDRENDCWSGDFCKEDFTKLTSDLLIKRERPEYLVYSFKCLSRLLCTYFAKKVFVLIDNYDAFVLSMSVKDCPTNYYKAKIIDILLKDNPCVGQALLTATLPLTADDTCVLHARDLDIYTFLDNNCFSKYYGLHSDYLDNILDMLVETGRNVATHRINKYYSGYARDQVYNIWSVLQYLRSVKAKSYWFDRKTLRTLKQFFKNLQIRSSIQILLRGGYKLVDAFQELSISDISELYQVLRSGEIEDLTKSVERTFFVMLCHMGYLSVSGVSIWESAFLKIPNEEIKHELSIIYDETTETFYNSTELDSVSSSEDLRW